MTSVATTTLTADGDLILLHPLSMRSEGQSWVIGRPDTGDFAIMPAVAYRVLTLLRAGHTVGETTQLLRAETGTAVAVVDFIASLDDLGFIASVNDKAREGPALPGPSLPWLRARHLRWVLHPATAWLTLTIIMAAAVMAAADPALLPRYRDLVWSDRSGSVLAVNAAICWALIGLHELGHLCTARAAGAPARLSLGTRLQFLAVQTDVSGVWAAPRRTRMTVYLSGMAVNLAAAAVGVLILGLAHPSGLTRHLLAAAVLQSLLLLLPQLLIFMRTDMYFLVQDLAGCANLYADGAAHLRYSTRRICHATRGDGSPPHCPAHGLPARERRAIHAYTWLLLTGTSACIAAATCITVPATVTLLAHAAGELIHGPLASRLDGTAALSVIAAFQFLWLRTWWRRHSGQVRAYLHIRQQPTL